MTALTFESLGLTTPPSKGAQTLMPSDEGVQPVASSTPSPTPASTPNLTFESLGIGQESGLMTKGQSVRPSAVIGQLGGYQPKSPEDGSPTSPMLSIVNQLMDYFPRQAERYRDARVAAEKDAFPPAGDYARRMAETPLGLVEAPIGLASGMAAFLAGVGVSMPTALTMPFVVSRNEFWSRAAEAKELLDKTLEATMYHPTTRVGNAPLEFLGGIFEEAHMFIDDWWRSSNTSLSEEDLENRIAGSQYLFDIATFVIPLMAAGRARAGKKPIVRPEEVKSEMKAAIKEMAPETPLEALDAVVAAAEAMVKDSRAEFKDARVAENQPLANHLRELSNSKEGRAKEQYLKRAEEVENAVVVIDSGVLEGWGKNPKRGTRAAAIRFLEEQSKKGEEVPPPKVELEPPTKPLDRPSAEIEFRKILDEVSPEDKMYLVDQVAKMPDRSRLPEIVKNFREFQQRRKDIKDAETQTLDIGPDLGPRPRPSLEPKVEGNTFESLGLIKHPVEKVIVDRSPIIEFDSPAMAKGEGFEIKDKRQFTTEEGARKVADRKGPEYSVVKIGDKFRVAKEAEPPFKEFKTLDEAKDAFDIGSEISKERAVIEAFNPEWPEFGIAKIGDKYYRTVEKAELPERIRREREEAAIAERLEEDIRREVDREPTIAELKAAEAEVATALSAEMRLAPEIRTRSVEELMILHSDWQNRYVAKHNAVVQEVATPKVRFDPTNIEHIRPFIDKYKELRGVKNDTRLIKKLQEGDPAIFNTKTGKDALDALGFEYGEGKSGPVSAGRPRGKKVERAEELGVIEDSLVPFDTREMAQNRLDKSGKDGEILGPDPTTGKYYIYEKSRLEDLGMEIELAEVSRERGRRRSESEGDWSLDDTGTRDLWDIFGNERGSIRGVGPIGMVGEMSQIFYSKALEVLKDMPDTLIKAEEIYKRLYNAGMGREEAASHLKEFFDHHRNEKISPRKVEEYIKSELVQVTELALDGKSYLNQLPRYKEYAQEPGGVMGTYSETFLTADKVRGFEWKDGHDRYTDINNPIVRIIHDEVRLPGGLKALRINEMQVPLRSQAWTHPAFPERTFSSMERLESAIRKRNEPIIDLRSVDELRVGNTLHNNVRLYDPIKAREFLVETSDIPGWGLSEQWIKYYETALPLNVDLRSVALNTSDTSALTIALNMGWNPEYVSGKVTPEILQKIKDSDSQRGDIRPFKLLYHIGSGSIRIENPGPKLSYRDGKLTDVGEFSKMPDFLQNQAYNMGVKWAIAKAKEMGADTILLTTPERLASKYSMGSGTLYTSTLPSNLTKQLGKEADKGTILMSDKTLGHAEYRQYVVGKEAPSMFSILGNQRGAIELPALSAEHLRKIRRNLERLEGLAKDAGKSLEGFLKENLSMEGVTLENTLAYARARTSGELDSLIRKKDPILENIVRPEGEIYSQTVKKKGDRIVSQMPPITEVMVERLRDSNRDMGWGKMVASKDPITGRTIYRQEIGFASKYMQAMETRLRGFNAFGFKDIYHMWRDSLDNARRVEVSLGKTLGAMVKDMTKAELDTMAIKFYKDMHGAEKAFEFMKIDMASIQPMTPKEAAIFKWMNDNLSSLREQANYSRFHSGQKPIPLLKDVKGGDNYIPLMRKLNVLREMGELDSVVRTSADKLANIHKDFTGLWNPHALKRKDVKLPIELDVVKAFNHYTNYTLRDIYIAPVAALAFEMANAKIPVKSIKGKVKNISLYNHNPGLWRVLSKWQDEIMGRDPVMKGLLTEHPFVAIVASAASRNLPAAIIGGLTRTVVVQPMALLNTATHVGFHNAFYGIVRTAIERPFKGREGTAWVQSKNMSLRNIDIALTDAAEMVQLGVLRGVRAKATEISYLGMSFTDSLTAEASWHAATRYGRKTLKLDGIDLIHYADDLIDATQGMGIKGAVAPIQASIATRWLALLQTFAIADFNLIVRDLLGIKNPDINNKVQVKKLLRYVIAGTLLGWLYKHVIGLDGVFPDPIGSYIDARDAGESRASAAIVAAIDVVEKFPIIGGMARWGSTPFGIVGTWGIAVSDAVPALKDLVSEGVDYMATSQSWDRKTKDQAMRDALIVGRAVGMTLGIPFTNQMAKSLRAAYKGGSPYEIIMGLYTDEMRNQTSGSVGPSRLKGPLEGGPTSPVIE